MLTALTFAEERPRGIKEKIISVFRPYRINVSIHSTHTASLREIKYTRLRGKTILHAIEKECLPQRAVLCADGTDLEGSLLRKIRNSSLTVRWCESFVTEVLGQLAGIKNELKVAFYDPEAEQPSFAKKLLSYVPSLTVVTEMPKFYEIEAARIAAETGAVMIVSNNIETLFPCDLIIAPTRITTPLPCVPLTPIFTVERPCVSITGTIIDGYRAQLPERYRELCPEGIDECELMSALYAFCGCAELGAEKPDCCVCMGKHFSAEDVVRIVKQNM